MTNHFLEKPEVVVIFLESKLRTDEVIRFLNKGVFGGLKSLIDNAVSSTFSPFVTLHTSLEHSLVNAISGHTGSVVVLGEGSVYHHLHKKLPSTRLVKSAKDLKGDSIFSNGQTDVLIVQLHSSEPTTQSRLAASDSFISKVQKIVSEQTSKYISFYTALKHHKVEDDISMEFRMPDPKKRANFEFQASNDTPAANITSIHWFNRWFPGWWWELASVITITIVITLFGTCILN